MINFYSFKNKSYIISSFLLALTIIVIFFKGLNLGIDFKGGLNFEVKTQLENNQISQIFDIVDPDREILIKQEIGSDVYTIRIETGPDNPTLIEEYIIVIVLFVCIDVLLWILKRMRRQKQKSI